MNAPDLTLLLRLCLLAFLIAFWFQIRAMASDRALVRKVEESDGEGPVTEVAPILRRIENVRGDIAAHATGARSCGVLVEASRGIVAQRSFFKRRRDQDTPSHGDE